MRSRSTPGAGWPKVLLVVEPGVDGVFRHVEGLVSAMMAADCEVALAYSSRRGSDGLRGLLARLAAAGVPCLDLRIGNAPGPADFPALRELWSLVEQWRPDVIHAHSSKAGALARLLPLLGVNVPALYTPNAYFGVNSPPGLKTTVFNAVEAALGGLGYTVHVSLSEDRFALARLLLPGPRRVVIPNGVDCARFHPATPEVRARLRTRWGLPQGAEVVGTVGRYSEQKDPRMLYAAMREVLRARPNAWFFHVGRGEQFDAITAEIATWAEATRIVRVEYLADTAEAYRAMDVFTLSSRYEGLPISGLEAIATGLPLALTRCPGNIDFEGTGLDALTWAEIGDPASLAAAVVQALDRRSGPACNHRTVGLRFYAQEVVLARLQACYEGLAARVMV